ncbi:FAD-dependent oxidoreductase [Barrientosiimonas marina]|uniref:FAD-dependent oxidoreductase n=1 Tax=Lentibacillus kimchii TaxID=1542911 RepID=A0ABW2UU56_9BACI
MKLIVVGSSHAGYEATQTLLKEMPDAEIHLYERGETASFLSCGIQSYLENVSQSLDELHYATADSYKKQGVNVHVNSEVTGLNPDEKTITVKSPDGETKESYDKLFLSPGAVPFELPVPGNNLTNVYYLRGRDWAGQVNERMKTAKQAIVVGGGYIGIEAAEAFTKAGIDTTVIDTLDNILPAYLDKEFTEVVEANAAEHGMKFRPGEMVKEIAGENGKVSKVVTDKAEYEADTVLIAAGVRPDAGWLNGIVDLDERGFVKVDEYLQTSHQDIYAGGDATKVPFAPGNDKRSIPLAGNARRQAVIAAKNMAADENKYKMPAVSSTSGLALFDYKFANTGIKDANADTLSAAIDSQYHEEQILPNFMHDDTKIAMKIHYEQDSHRIVGAQLMSQKDVMMAINAISVAISANWTLEDLALADFFFQPEYDDTWNFLNVLAQQALGETFGSDQQLF